ncbi:MAG: Lrp/AsnC ligand binding domain-containing protein [Solirubrobacterales bacterium]
MPEVDAVHTIAGDPDALVHLRVRDVADLSRVIDLLRRSGKVTGTKTLIVLGSETRAEPRCARTRFEPDNQIALPGFIRLRDPALP